MKSSIKRIKTLQQNYVYYRHFVITSVIKQRSSLQGTDINMYYDPLHRKSLNLTMTQQNKLQTLDRLAMRILP